VTWVGFHDEVILSYANTGVSVQRTVRFQLRILTQKDLASELTNFQEDE